MRPAPTATFRFYGELNDFLAPVRRRQDVTLRCAQAATTKHMIEALGVPHTEVDAILVNGEWSGFERLLAEGDRVAVYPAFGVLALPPGQRLQPVPPEPRFVADAHLGALARYLRMAGFDTLYENSFDDDTVERIAAEDDRTILTRDRELLKRRHVSHGCYVHALKPEQQFREIVARLALAGRGQPFSLCLHCNLPLRPVDKAAVADRLPAAVRLEQDEFRTCERCGRIYWKGSHYRRMSALLGSALGTGS